MAVPVPFASCVICERQSDNENEARKLSRKQRRQKNSMNAPSGNTQPPCVCQQHTVPPLQNKWQSGLEQKNISHSYSHFPFWYFYYSLVSQAESRSSFYAVRWCWLRRANASGRTLRYAKQASTHGCESKKRWPEQTYDGDNGFTQPIVCGWHFMIVGRTEKWTTGD